ncbi:beta-glucosidase [Pseudomonas oryzihabitans]|nr:beta-glucosidase [Pseudomonas psychrotolerans]
MTPDAPFQSFFMAGFECSCHRRADGRRLDLLASTAHDRWAAQDYDAVAAQGLRTVRDGIRWHRVESQPGHYDWASVLPQLRAAQAAGVQVIWDLCHYGWPDHLDIWRPAFVEAFARFAAAFARLLREEGETQPCLAPINETSYWAWAGGDQGLFNPTARGRGQELKHQLVRASIAAIEAIRAELPGTRFVAVDPLINVVARRPEQREVAEAHRQAQFEAWDLLSGRQWPGLGGRPDYLDILGLNYYSDNQWYLGGGTLAPEDPAYRPLQGILAELHQRYGRPLLIAETGAEGPLRASWLDYVADQVGRAIRQGVPVQGICLYPVLDYPGWNDDRLCPTGLFGMADGAGRRTLYAPLAEVLQRHRQSLEGRSPA